MLTWYMSQLLNMFIEGIKKQQQFFYLAISIHEWIRLLENVKFE